MLGLALLQLIDSHHYKRHKKKHSDRISFTLTFHRYFSVPAHDGGDGSGTRWEPYKRRDIQATRRTNPEVVGSNPTEVTISVARVVGGTLKFPLKG